MATRMSSDEVTLQSKSPKATPMQTSSRRRRKNFTVALVRLSTGLGSGDFACRSKVINTVGGC